MGFLKKFFLGGGALALIFLGGNGTQSSNLLLQGGGFVGLIIGLVFLYLFTKMAWRAMGCLPSFIVVLSILSFIIYAIGGFNNGLGGIMENLKMFIGGSNATVGGANTAPQVELKENFSSPQPNATLQNENENAAVSQTQPQQQANTVQNQAPAQQQQQNGGGFLAGLFGAKNNNQPRGIDMESLPSFTSPVSVVTADTLNAQGYVIKLYGIAAPDITQTCANKTGAAYNCGQQAALWLKSWLGDNPVTCRIMKQNDNGLMIGTCSLGKYDIGAALVNAGWAVAYTKQTSVYVPYEQNAEQNGYGLWQGKFYKPWDWEALKHQKPKYKIIKPKDPNRKSFFKF